MVYDVVEALRLISGLVNDYVAGFLGLSEGNAWSINAFDVSAIAVLFLPVPQLILLP